MGRGVGGWECREVREGRAGEGVFAGDARGVSEDVDSWVLAHEFMDVDGVDCDLDLCS